MSPLCVTGMTLNDLGEEWAIPAGTLNALWGTVLPRLVAKAWQENQQFGSPSVAQLIERIEEFRFGQPVEPNENYWNRLGCIAKAKFSQVHQYLTAGPGRIPIRFSPTGGYDFLLSDRGLDIHLPNKPVDLAKLLKFYTIRSTGRRPIGTPLYLARGSKATATDSPTGPSQILTDPASVLVVALESVYANANLTDPLCVAALDCMAMKMGVEIPGELDGDRWLRVWIMSSQWTSTTGALTPADRFPRGLDWTGIHGRLDEVLGSGPHGLPDHLTERILLPPDGAREPFVVFWDLLTEPQTFTTTAGQVACMVSPFRVWQVEGTVYRGMMTEFPRIVAEAWFEEELGVPVGDPRGLRYRLDPPAGSGKEGVEEREIFKERLETMLSSPERMDFRARGPGGGAYAGGGAWAARWDTTDVMVTNKGFYYPEVKGLNAELNDTIQRWDAAHPALPSADLGNALLNTFMQITAGRSGNPVFTDSIVTEGEGEW